jgi:hypothetical protein
MTMNWTKTLVVLMMAATPAAALTHTVVPGDHLWGLAGHYYKNHFRWKVIYAANREKIKDPHWIYPGQVFEIPEVPDASIGELPARPVEADPTGDLDVKPDPVVAQPAPPEPAKPAKPKRTDDLSVEMPKGFAGQYPSMDRQAFSKNWDPDGKNTEFMGREALAAEGDWVVGKVHGDAAVGDRFTVYRAASRREQDEQRNVNFFQAVASIEVKESLGGSRYRFLILKSRDTAQLGDLLAREAR